MCVRQLIKTGEAGSSFYTPFNNCMAWPIFPLACTVRLVRLLYSKAVGKHGDFFETHFPIPHSTIAPTMYPLHPPAIPIAYSYCHTTPKSRSTFSSFYPTTPTPIFRLSYSLTHLPQHPSPSSFFH